MGRILKPGGHMIIQDVNCSKMLKLLLILMNHEGYDSTINVFDERNICTDPEDLWAGNNAIPNLLFDDINKNDQQDWFYFTMIFLVSFCTVFFIDILLNLSLPDLSPVFYYVGTTLIIFPIINLGIDFIIFITRLLKS